MKLFLANVSNQDDQKQELSVYWEHRHFKGLLKSQEQLAPFALSLYWEQGCLLMSQEQLAPFSYVARGSVSAAGAIVIYSCNLIS